MPVSVSSAEFLRAYGRFSAVAQSEPVAITNHGRESLVLLSAREYRRLTQTERKTLSVWDLSEDDIRALEASQAPAEAARFDSEYDR